MQVEQTVTCPWCERTVPLLPNGSMLDHYEFGALRTLCVGSHRWPWQHDVPSPTIGTAA